MEGFVVLRLKGSRCAVKVKSVGYATIYFETRQSIDVSRTIHPLALVVSMVVVAAGTSAALMHPVQSLGFSFQYAIVVGFGVATPFHVYAAYSPFDANFDVAEYRRNRGRMGLAADVALVVVAAIGVGCATAAATFASSLPSSLANGFGIGVGGLAGQLTFWVRNREYAAESEMFGRLQTLD